MSTSHENLAGSAEQPVTNSRNLRVVIVVGINGRQGTSVANAFLKDGRYRKFGYQAGMAHTDSAARIIKDMDVGFGYRLLDAAAATSGLQTLIMSTLPVIGLDGARCAMHLAEREFEAKREHICYLGRCLPELGQKTIVVKPALRMEDYRLTLQMHGDGTLSFGTTAPAQARFHWINMAEDFGAFVHTLASRFPSKSFAFAAYSDSVSGEKICALISKISGVPCKYLQYTNDQIGPAGNDITYFEAYLKDVLPEQLKGLRNGVIKDQSTSSEGVPQDIDEVDEESIDRQRTINDMSEEELIEVYEAMAPEISPNGVLEGPFMGYQTEESVQEFMEHFSLDERFKMASLRYITLEEQSIC
ncbi:hypothetical protein BU23DRAFT_603376 [Bimuria novae-zelandiae CBS 107.79]|uniref:NmrA-like domain-containing protein n=1 Tax=Bimuria novae-zelandiae CBS 107.79 TaxID=1447943 RepID=A0A6A5UQQ0_9PLEO|nr:hypothetical protein BU23DRAFT_603376 [Bimuria novae-zelandiae CBS 107.79]